MKLATIRLQGSANATQDGAIDDPPEGASGGAPGTRAAVVLADSYAPLDGYADVGAFLAASEADREAAVEAAVNGRTDRLLATDGSAGGLLAADTPVATLVSAPSKVFCIGLNYRNHILETGLKIPEFPTVFTKFAESLTGAFDEIEIPSEDHRVDWEGELAVVVGSGGRRLAEEDAGAAIAGYAVANDVSMRGWQGRTTEWTQGKCWEAATPIGPYLVTGDEFEQDATITTKVNGEVVQRDSVGDLVFGPAALVSYLSTMVTLRPGDLILTGTPAGVALGRRNESGRHPWLRPGDVLETEIGGLGVQRNILR